MFQMETISAKMLDYYVGRQDSYVIDLRDADAYAKSHVRGAVNIPYEELEERWTLPDRFAREKILIFYCERGGASMKAASAMAKLGYETRSVIGGFEAYRGRNLVISGQS
jgi:rhodanese-related sulfurtransferase